MVYKHAVVAAFCIYAQRGADATKMGSWRPCIYFKEMTMLIMENHGIVFLNFGENPVSIVNPLMKGFSK